MHLSRRPESWNSETSTAQYIIQNIYRAVWNSRRPRKTPRQPRPGAPLPLPRPPKKKTNNPPENASPSTSHHQCAPGIDPISKPPSVNPVQRTPGKGSTPRTSKRPRVDVIKNTHLKPSCHYTGTTTVVHPNHNVTYVIREPSSPPQEPNPSKRARATFPTKRNPVVCPRHEPGLSVH